jgi:uroporphyrinogen decarboxylase
MSEMTSRERFWKTVNFQEPDRVPIQFTGMASSIASVRDGFGPYGYDAVCRYLGIKDYEDPIGDFGAINLHPVIPERAHNDFALVVIGDPGRIKLPDYDVNHAERHKTWGFHTIMHNGTTAFPDELTPFYNKTSIKDIEEYEFWPDPDDPVYYEGVREKAKKLHENTQYAVIADSGYAALIDFVYNWLRGFANWLSDPYEYPEFYIALKNKITDISIEISKRFYSEVGPYVDLTHYYSDQGTQAGATFSVDYCNKWIVPFQKKWNDAIKHLTKAKRFVHSCGSIYHLIPSFRHIIRKSFFMVELIYRNCFLRGQWMKLLKVLRK